MAIDRKQVEEEFRNAATAFGDAPTRAALNGKNKPGWIKDDYDEKQRAQMLEVESEGPAEGLIQTDLLPDLGGDADSDEIEDDADHLDAVVDTNKPEGARDAE